MKKLASLFVALFVFGIISVQAQSGEVQTVERAVEKLRKAMVEADKSTLENLTAEELSYGHSSGTIEDKDNFVQSIVSGKSDFVSIDLREQTVKIAGDVAIVRHKLFAETNDSGKPGSVKLGVLLIWQKREGSWKLLARQAFKI